MASAVQHNSYQIPLSIYGESIRGDEDAEVHSNRIYLSMNPIWLVCGTKLKHVVCVSTLDNIYRSLVEFPSPPDL